MTVNLFFLLVFLFGYSPISLLFLFISWLILVAIVMHLFFQATSDDNYSDIPKEDQVAHEKELQKHFSRSHDDKDEYISAHLLMTHILSIYKVALTLATQYRAFEQARNPR